MFEKEVSRILRGVKVVWYPFEKLCLVLYKSGRQKVYKNIPKKYKKLFDERKTKEIAGE